LSKRKAEFRPGLEDQGFFQWASLDCQNNIYIQYVLFMA